MVKALACLLRAQGLKWPSVVLFPYCSSPPAVAGVENAKPCMSH